MRRRFQGLHQADASTTTDSVPNGLYRVQVTRAHYRWHAQKPLYSLRFSVLEPKAWAGRSFAGRIYCTPRALWKLNWFLRDFGYDPDLLGRDEVDERSLLGLTGVVRTSRIALPGRSFLNLEAFAPAGEWEELTPAAAGARP